MQEELVAGRLCHSSGRFSGVVLGSARAGYEKKPPAQERCTCGLGRGLMDGFFAASGMRCSRGRKVTG